MSAPMNPVSLIDVASYLPENRVGTEYFAQFARSDRMAKNVMFRSPSFRHHLAPDESAVDMAERAIAPLIERHGAAEIEGVDILITHTQLPDIPIHGSGADLSKRMRMSPSVVLDVHNGGCAAFPYMIQLAQMFLWTSAARSALIVAVQNTAGQFFTQSNVRTLAAASVPGDGCGVGLLRKSDEAPVLAVECRPYSEFAGGFVAEADPPRKYWEPGPGHIQFVVNEAKIATVYARGNRIVPEVAQAVCGRIGIKPAEVDVLVTNQPNRLFLRNWHDALEIPAERHPDTFDECGNLFAAGIPVTLDRENQAGRIPKGALVLMSAFAHAGDFAGAAVVRWGM